ncbi:hypothetical protein LINPERHAP2_LOCUS39685 [Linum perenne]
MNSMRPLKSESNACRPKEMREKVGEKGLSRVQGGLGVSDVSASGGVSLSDLSCRSIQIKDARISVVSSDGRFGSVCRLLVSKVSASHFIFIDRTLVFWLEGVLQVASESNWSFPASCTSSSFRRSLSVCAFNSSRGRMLKMSELCSNGKSFFVIIPAESSQGGWWGFLRLLQAWIVGSLAPPPPAGPPPSSAGSSLLPSSLGKSYAQAVKGDSWSTVGRCVLESVDGIAGVRVENEGVQERLSFLDNCIVFRFISYEVVDWTAFRRWANRSWGTAIDASLLQLDDGLWMLHCDSKSKVNRILSINRWSFGDKVLLLDRWIPEAGRSKVLLNNEVVWITVRGIPIHLRATDLFRQIGLSCGEYLGYEETNSVSSIRINIRLVGVLPEEIPVCYKDWVFPVSVEADVVGLSPFQLRTTSEAGRWRSKRKASLLPHSPPDLVCTVSSSGLQSAETKRFHGDSPPNPVFGSSPEMVKRSPEVLQSSELTVSTENPSEDVICSPRTCCNFVGLKLDDSDRLSLIFPSGEIGTGSFLLFSKESSFASITDLSGGTSFPGLRFGLVSRGSDSRESGFFGPTNCRSIRSGAGWKSDIRILGSDGLARGSIG